MAHRALTLRATRRGPGSAAVVAALVSLTVGCGGAATPPPNGGARANLEAKGAPAFPLDDASFGRYHSKRFLLSFPLPDGKAWKIDDRSAAELVATHAPTSSSLRVAVTRETELTSRARCEARARETGWVQDSPRAPLTTLEEHVQTGPEAYDSRVWVALQPGKPGGPLLGHVFLFGGFLRQCLLVRYTTEVPSARDEDALAARLALVRTRVLRGLELDPLRVTDEAEVPRTKPNITR